MPMLHQIPFGPKVVKDIDVTRHILKYAPEYIDKETRPVTAIAPGVLGTTGIETMEIIKGIVENIKLLLLIHICLCFLIRLNNHLILHLAEVYL